MNLLAAILLSVALPNVVLAPQPVASQPAAPEPDAPALAEASMPGLFEAYARAFARNFSLQDLRAIGAFVHTPAGLKFVQRSQFLLSDPDVANWQRQEMASSMQRLAPKVAALRAKLSALRNNGGIKP